MPCRIDNKAKLAPLVVFVFGDEEILVGFFVAMPAAKSGGYADVLLRDASLPLAPC